MASFTDNVQQLTNFNPYIQQQPLETMGKVGMYKQEQYDQGIEKIQKSFDTIAGMPVTNKHKAYLQSKLNEMGNQMKIFGASDFSQGSLVNSTTSQINSIANDETVQAGVQSALRQKKEYEAMEKAREKGELTPAHQDNFLQQQNLWEANDDLKKTYNAKYINFFDADKLFIENIDKVKPANLSHDQIFEMKDGKFLYNSDGTPKLTTYMTRIKREGRVPEALLSIIENTANDPRVQQELDIRGSYVYKNYSSEKIAEISISSLNNTKNIIESRIDDLLLDQITNPKDTTIQEKIDKEKTSLEELRKSPQKIVENILNNLKGYKQYLYKESYKNNLFKTFGQVTESREVLDSPPYKSFRAAYEFRQEQALARDKLSSENLNKSLDRRQDAEQFKITTSQKEKELKLKGIELGVDSDGKRLPTDVPLNITDDQVINMRDKSLSDLSSSKINTSESVIFRHLYTPKSDPKATEKNEKAIQKIRLNINPNTDLPYTRQEAIHNIMLQNAKAKGQTYEDYISGATVRMNNKIGINLEKLDPSEKAEFLNYESASTIFDLENKKFQKVKAGVKIKENELIKNVLFKEEYHNINGKVVRTNKNIANDVIKLENIYSEKAVGKNLAVNTKELEKRISESLDPLVVKELKQRAENNQRNRTMSSGMSMDPRAFYKYPILEKFSNISNYRNTIINKIKDLPKYEAQLTRGYMSINPAKQDNFATGITKQDDKRYVELQGISSDASAYGQFEGTNPKKVIEAVADLERKDFEKAGFATTFEPDAKGIMSTFIRDRENNKVKIDPVIAKRYNMTESQLYQNNDIKLETESIKDRGNKSTEGPLSDPSTYRNESTLLNTKDFIQLRNTDYKVKVGFGLVENENRQNVYYPYLYINKGGNDIVVPLKVGSTDLEYLAKDYLTTFITPSNLSIYLK